MPLLEVRDLTVEYHTETGIYCAVDDLCLTLEEGKSLGIVGESGCGKTTAMLALLRLLPENGRIVKGEIIFDNTNLLGLTPKQMRDYRWLKISMIFQGAMNALNPVQTVGSQIAEVLIEHDIVDRKITRSEVLRLLDLVGVSKSRIDQYPHEYSGGMRQRAMIAMALACKPKIIIADEPTTALDVMIQAQILELLENLQKDFGISIVIVTHDLGIVAEFCDDVLVMYGGKTAEYRNADAIFNDPLHPYTQRLLNAFPDVVNPRSSLASIPGHPPALNALPPGCRFEPRCQIAEGFCAESHPPLIEVQPGNFVSCFKVQVKNGQ